MKGIDVSSYQGTIDWSKVKKDGCEFAIIRLGIGDNITSQDDLQLQNNIKGCQENGIPYSFYLVSYAKRTTGNESVESEIEHTKRLIQGTNPFAIFYDMEIENTTYLGKDTLINFAIQYCDYFKNLGYNVGVYANKNWFTNYLNYDLLKSKGYKIWLAHYGVNQPGLECDLWQYSDKGNVNGINTNTTDLNIMYNDIRNSNKSSNNTSTNNNKVDITYQIWDDVKNKWLPNVKNDSDYAGIYGHDVCCIYANTSKGNVFYKVHYKGGKWLPEVKNRNDYAGSYNKPIDGFMIKSDTKQLTYRVHLRKTNKWLPWVTGYNQNDSKNGYAGILGQEIDAIQIK